MVALDANLVSARGAPASHLMLVRSEDVVNCDRVHVCDSKPTCHGLEIHVPIRCTLGAASAAQLHFGFLVLAVRRDCPAPMWRNSRSCWPCRRERCAVPLPFSAMEVMGSWPHLADRREHCRVMREAFVYVPDALSQPDSCHVRRGIRSGPSVAGPIVPPMRTPSYDDGDRLQADMVMALRTQLPRADSDANIDRARTWTVSDADHGRDQRPLRSRLREFPIAGRPSAHDEDDFDGAEPHSGHELVVHSGHHESHSRLQLIVFPSWPQSVLDNHLLFSQRGFVDGDTRRTGSRQSTRNDSLPSNAAASDDLIRKRPMSQRVTLARVALPSSCAIMWILCHDRCKVGCHASRSSRGQPAFRIGARLVASSTAIMSMHLRQHMQGRMPHITFISRPARIPRSSRPQAV